MKTGWDNASVKHRVTSISYYHHSCLLKAKPYKSGNITMRLLFLLTYLQNRNRVTGTENQTGLPVGKGVGEGQSGSLGLLDANYYI